MQRCSSWWLDILLIAKLPSPYGPGHISSWALGWMCYFGMMIGQARGISKLCAHGYTRYQPVKRCRFWKVRNLFILIRGGLQVGEGSCEIGSFYKSRNARIIGSAPGLSSGGDHRIWSHGVLYGLSGTKFVDGGGGGGGGPTILFATMWSIWLARNNLIFSNKEVDWERVFNIILLRVTTWIKANHPSFPYHLTDLLASADSLKN
ncbi:hypothetical protein Tsubulata_013274 [Turnera subulata]|uniref:Uncharacterized protein n=1 Tax=Turnera subulata TaxID=218843 RepID=A0A9Q0FP37_9ROSI|nr:hypothetical protein Tsubulata_013274 [Turnera subulata]